MAGEGQFRAALQEWGPLLELLLQPSTWSPVGAASHWVRSQGLSMSASSSHRTSLTSHLWRLVPHVLAYQVALLQNSHLKKEKGKEPEPFTDRKRKRTTVGNSLCSSIWMQTLPIIAQTNILCFLEVEHRFFRLKDLETLALQLLSSRDANFWVSRAAQSLLDILGCSDKIEQGEQMLEHALPSCLLGYKVQPPLLPWMPITQPSQWTTVKRSFQEKVNPSLIDSCNEPQEDACILASSENERSGLANESAQEEKDFICVSQFPPLHSKGHERILKGFSLPMVGQNPDNEAKGLVMSGKPDEKLLEEPGPAEEEAVSVSALAYSLRQAWLERQPTLDDLHNLKNLPDFKLFLNVLKPWELKDDTILNMTKVFLIKDSSLEWSVQISSFCLLPKLLLLEQPASRFLVSAAIEACKVHQRAMIDALLVPLVLAEKGPTKAQCDVLNRLLKEVLSDSHVFSFCGKIFLCSRRQNLPFSDSPFMKDSFLTSSVTWSEPLWTVLQNALSRPIELDIEVLEAFVNVCKEEVVKYAKSLKFCNLLLFLLSKYGSRLKPFKSTLLCISELTETFITKALVTKSSDL